VIVLVLLALTFVLRVPTAAPSLSAIITPEIFSPQNNIGLLNSQAYFIIDINNELHNSQPINVTVFGPIGPQGPIVNITTFNVNAYSAENVTVNQQLTYPGTWQVEVKSGAQFLQSYTFTTADNKGDADYQINQFQNMKDTENLAAQANLTAILSIIIGTSVSVISLVVSIRSSRKKQSNGQDIERAHSPSANTP
jgi:hypothetical protein